MSGVGSSRRCSKSRRPSDHSNILRRSWGVKPEVTKSWTAPRSPIVVITAERAPVSARALSTTSWSTVARSRLWLTPEYGRTQQGDAVIGAAAPGPRGVSINQRNDSRTEGVRRGRAVATQADATTNDTAFEIESHY